MLKKRISVILVVLCMCLLLSGAGWFNTTKVVIDTEENYVYKFYMADDIISEFVADSKAAKTKYQDEPVLLCGKVVSVGKKGKNIVLTGTNTSALTIECTFDKNLRTTAQQYNAGDRIVLFGCIEVSLIGGDISLEADKISGMPVSATSKDMYYLLDGSSFDKRNASVVNLNQGGVTYYIPPSWESEEVMHNIREEKLGSIEGYQYVLNKQDSSGGLPESLFVCYFDNKTQLADYLNDSDETELIEKAIVENILGSVGRFPSKEVTTYYDQEYTYYTGSFKSILEAGDGYHTEFLFRADGEEGIVLILYVYRDTRHLSDVLFVTRFLEIW